MYHTTKMTTKTMTKTNPLPLAGCGCAETHAAASSRRAHDVVLRHLVLCGRSEGPHRKLSAYRRSRKAWKNPLDRSQQRW